MTQGQDKGEVARRLRRGIPPLAAPELFSNWLPDGEPARAEFLGSSLTITLQALRLPPKEKAQDLAEYALLLVPSSTTTSAALRVTGQAVRDAFSNSAQNLATSWAGNALG